MRYVKAFGIVIGATVFAGLLLAVIFMPFYFFGPAVGLVLTFAAFLAWVTYLLAQELD